MANDPATGPRNAFDRIGAQATRAFVATRAVCTSWPSSSASSTARDLEEWMQLRARLDHRGGSLRPLGTDALRAEYEQRGRELAALQARLKRLDVVARQLDLLWTYLESTDRVDGRAWPDGRRLARRR